MAMTLEWFDAPNYFNGAETGVFYESFSAPTVLPQGTGRYGDSYSKVWDIVGSVTKLGLTPSFWKIVGFSWKEAAASGPRNPLTAIDGLGVASLIWRYEGSGGFCSVRRAIDNVTLATFTAYAATGEWVNTIMAFRSDPTHGELHVYKNGALLSSQYDIKTQSTAFGAPGAIAGYKLSGPIHVTDVWSYTGSPAGSLTADVIGDKFVWTGFARADGNYTDHTYAGSGVTANWQAVDDTATDNDTTFNQSSTVGDRDSFAVTAVPADIVDSANINGVRVVAAMRFTDSGPHTANVFTRYPVSGTPVDYDGTGKALSSTYRAPEGLWTTVPGTTTAWTITEIDDTEFGYRNES